MSARAQDRSLARASASSVELCASADRSGRCVECGIVRGVGPGDSRRHGFARACFVRQERYPVSSFERCVSTPWWVGLLLVAGSGCVGVSDAVGEPEQTAVVADSLREATPPPAHEPPARRVRIGLFNIKELTTEKILDVDADGAGQHPQLRAAAEIVRVVRPDVLVLQEIDHDYASVYEGFEVNARRFMNHYLARSDEPIDYPFSYAAPNNTGRLSGHDLDNDGHIAAAEDRGTRRFGGDSQGYGEYPGQYSMAVLSRFPVDALAARTFQRFLWRDFVGHHIPEGYYTDDELADLRLSSKSHWDLPLTIDGRPLHLWISHPTPPVFDGPEDRNGRRNFDEIGFWVAYLDGADWLMDDRAVRGGFGADAPFVIVGDLNSYPESLESRYNGRAAISQLLDHPRVQDPGAWVTRSGRDAVALRPQDLAQEQVTASFAGGVRVDYVLPSRGQRIVGGGVYRPSPEDDPTGAQRAALASDHFLVWLDLEL